MRRSLAALIVVAALGVQGIAQGAPTGLPTLYVNYTMNCTFNMTDAMGKQLTSIPPGTYQILVTSPVPFAAVDLVGINDMTACRGSANFQLTGPGVSLMTTMDDGDSDSAFISGTFQPSSSYTAVDTTQPSVTRITFTTTATGVASGPATTPATTTTAAATHSASLAAGTPPQTRGTLTGTVGPGGGVKLTAGGSGVTSLHTGRYTFVVTDHSPHDGFVLEHGAGKPLWITTRAFVGRRAQTVNLTKGEWAFDPSGSGPKSYFKVG